MSERWLDSQRDDDAEIRAERFWTVMREELDAGAFWADRIKHHRDEPGKRLQMAMNRLPLPAAFREAAIALRAIIRAKRKDGASFQEEIGLLYWLAAIESFMLPYAEALREPGFNVLEAIPGKRLRSLPIDYKALGYERLALLNKTDRKWLVELWGEPQTHSTLNEIHRALWDEYEGKLIERRRKERDRFTRDIKALTRGSGSIARTARKAEKSGCLGALLIVSTGVLSLVLAGTMFLARG